MKLIFAAEGTFEALYRARSYAKQNGFSYGSDCAGRPTALMQGDWNIAKWHNLSAKERREVHGTITGAMRCGPVTVEIKVLFEEKATQAQVEREFEGLKAAGIL